MTPNNHTAYITLHDTYAAWEAIAEEVQQQLAEAEQARQERLGQR